MAVVIVSGGWPTKQVQNLSKQQQQQNNNDQHTKDDNDNTDVVIIIPLSVPGELFCLFFFV